MNLYRGTHWCEFCPAPRIEKTGGSIRIIDGPPNSTGNGEIRVTGGDGRIYVAPVLITHYVAMHEYAPPQEFVEACLRQVSQCQDDA